SITVWYAAATANDKGRLQRIIRSAEKVIGCNLPSLQDLFASRTLRRAGKIVADPFLPGHKLFEVLPSGRGLQSIRTKTSHHKTSFFPAAVGFINKLNKPNNCFCDKLSLHCPISLCLFNLPLCYQIRKENRLSKQT